MRDFKQQIFHRVSENELLQVLLKKNMEANANELVPLEDFNCESIHIYLAAEHTPGQSGKYFNFQFLIYPFYFFHVFKGITKWTRKKQLQKI